jgi:hypothetical protein
MKDINELFSKEEVNDEELEEELKALLEESEGTEKVFSEIDVVEPPRPVVIPPPLPVEMGERVAKDITLPSVPAATSAGIRARQATLADVFASV